MSLSEKKLDYLLQKISNRILESQFNPEVNSDVESALVIRRKDQSPFPSFPLLVLSGYVFTMNSLFFSGSVIAPKIVSNTINFLGMAFYLFAITIAGETNEINPLLTPPFVSNLQKMLSNIVPIFFLLLGSLEAVFASFTEDNTDIYGRLSVSSELLILASILVDAVNRLTILHKSMKNTPGNFLNQNHSGSFLQHPEELTVDHD